MHAILRVNNLSKRFANRIIINSVSFELDSHKIYALMGANGSGKTTLFNILTGFLSADSGDICFKGKEIRKLLPYQISRLGIGRTFQDLRLISKLTVRENILLSMKGNPTDAWVKAMLPRSLNERSELSMNERAQAIINEYFINDVNSNLAGEISYGQQKLLNTACCIANGAELLLLDEPVAGINDSYIKTIAKLLKRLKTEGKTVLLIEHNGEFIKEVADTIFLLTQGGLRVYDNYDQLKADPSLIESYR